MSMQSEISAISAWKTKMAQALANIGVNVSGLKIEEWAEKIKKSNVTVPE